jgi:IS30 family transposase
MPKGYGLSETVRGAIWKVRAEGLSDREIGRQLGLARGSVSNHLTRAGGIRPRARRRAEVCLSFKSARRSHGRSPAASRPAPSHGRWAAHIRRSRVEINRCGGRLRYRADTADREAWRRSRRSRPTKLELDPELRRVVEERLRDNHSPEQISGWLRIRYPDNEAMNVSRDETIYRALYVQARGALKRELTRHLRRGRSRRYARSQSSKGQRQGKLTGMVMISERPPEVETEPSRATGRATC